MRNRVAIHPGSHVIHPVPGLRDVRCPDRGKHHACFSYQAGWLSASLIPEISVSALESRGDASRLIHRNKQTRDSMLWTPPAGPDKNILAWVPQGGVPVPGRGLSQCEATNCATKFAGLCCLTRATAGGGCRRTGHTSTALATPRPPGLRFEIVGTAQQRQCLCALWLRIGRVVPT